MAMARTDGSRIAATNGGIAGNAIISGEGDRRTPKNVPTRRAVVGCPRGPQASADSTSGRAGRLPTAPSPGPRSPGTIRVEVSHDPNS
jgi:hypothetical protein